MAYRDYYAGLGLTQSATRLQIRAAFHALASRHRPDKSSTDDVSIFQRVREAYEVLSDLAARARYDHSYGCLRNQFDIDDGLTGTRTAAYETEEATRETARRPERAATYAEENPWHHEE
jgi:curved DNA-binding protein CbpA